MLTGPAAQFGLGALSRPGASPQQQATPTSRGVGLAALAMQPGMDVAAAQSYSNVVQPNQFGAYAKGLGAN